MPFQTPITIRDVLSGIQAQKYVLPAIQREFVWTQDQVARLFDSLMRGYPIGSFLFWKVDGAQVDRLRFYGFLRDYNEFSNAHCPILDLPSEREVTAILDGQQRLTSLNVGLRGSFALRSPGRWAKLAANYPKRTLYLDLATDAPENEEGVIYSFRFLTESPATTDDHHWFPVPRVLDTGTTMGTLHKYLVAHGLGNEERPYQVLEKLWEAVYHRTIINFYEEDDQDIDRVLDIFIRVNSAGTVLSYSDLLLSIATAQWPELDARAEVHGFVDELNRMGLGFAFDKDVVLKAGLVLTGVSDVGFKVTNFNRKNMATLEAEWLNVEECLRLAAGLLADFGLSASSLTANSVLIPVAYYVRHRHLTEKYRHGAAEAADRRRLGSWVIRTLLKPGVWGSGLDTLLRDLRRVIVEHGASGFPEQEIGQAMAARGKPLTFNSADLAELAEIQYGDKRVFPLLALLFPGVNTRNLFHVDHVFPRKMFKPSSITAAGLPPGEVGEYREMVNALPNLQLLEGPENLEKQATPPLTWASTRFGTELAPYLIAQELSGLTDSLVDFRLFYDQRRERLASRLAQLLGVEEDGDLQEVWNQPGEGHGATPRADFNLEAAQAFADAEGIELSRRTDTVYEGESGRVRVVCLVSKEYPGGKFWWTIRSRHVAALAASPRPFLILACGSPEVILAFPWSYWEAVLAVLNSTGPGHHRNWHIEVRRENASYFLLPRSGEERLDLSAQLLHGRHAS